MRVRREFRTCVSQYVLPLLLGLAALSSTQPAHAKVKVIYRFAGQSVIDGSQPSGDLAVLSGKHGASIYGTTFSGGIDVQKCEDRGFLGCGTVFRISNGVEEVLYRFKGGLDGGNPNGVIRDGAGNLYGTTKVGGQYYSAGAVFKLARNGKETTLFSFDGHETGSQPLGGVILDGADNLYGTTSLGGQSGWGTVFKLAPDGAETVLHSFGYPKDADGAIPVGRLIRDAAGNLYGVTNSG
ncbi:MAG: hypothetical protein JOY77_10240, partial [Alphaproteobacteria bacterium]|nr:hypothetical protein [Alphaproteobacteria bacterium]